MSKTDREPKFVQITATMTVDYMFNLNGVDGRTPEEIIKEFFMDYSINRHHTARDAARVGNGTTLLKVEVTEIKPFDDTPLPITSTIFTEENGPNGDIMFSLSDFRKHEKDGSIIDDDGVGYYSNGYHYTRDGDVFDESTQPEGTTHVLWFNK